MGKYMTEAEAWREIARTYKSPKHSPFLCDRARCLERNYRISYETMQLMVDRIAAHIGNKFSAYSTDSDRYEDDAYTKRHREARCLAALWLAHEAEDAQ